MLAKQIFFGPFTLRKKISWEFNFSGRREGLFRGNLISLIKIFKKFCRNLILQMRDLRIFVGI